jgi:MFS family permease
VKRRYPFVNPWWIVFAATAGGVVGNSPITLYTFGLFLKPVTREFGWGRARFAVALFVFQMVGAVSMPFIGKLIDRCGIRRITLTFIVLFCISIALLSEARSAIEFAALYGIAGLAGSGRGPIAYTKAISAWFEDHRGLALGIGMTGLGMGASVIPEITRLLIRDVGWRGAYLGLAVIVFMVSFPTVALFIREPAQLGNELSQAKVTQATIPVERPLRSGKFWLLAIAILLASTALTGTFTHIIPLLTDTGVSLQLATSIVSVAALALILGQFVAGFALDRLPAAVVAGSFLVPAIVGIILIGFGGTYIEVLLGSILVALGIGAEANLAAFLVSRHFGLSRFGETFGAVLAVSVLGNGLGPWVMGVAYDRRHSYNPALAAFCLALVISVLLISRLGPYPFQIGSARSQTSPVASTAV